MLNGSNNFIAGPNVTSGTAAIQVAGVTSNNGSLASPNLNPTTASNGTLTVGVGFSSRIVGTFINGTVPALQQGPNDDPDKDGTTISYTLTPGTPPRNFVRLQVTQS